MFRLARQDSYIHGYARKGEPSSSMYMLNNDPRVKWKLLLNIFLMKIENVMIDIKIHGLVI